MGDWYFINLIVPILLPLGLLGTLRLFRLPGRAWQRANPLIVVKDGQHSWTGLTLCMGALYEFRHIDSARMLPEPWASIFFWILFLDLLLLTIVAAVAPLFPTKVVRTIGARNGLSHYRVLAISFILTIVAALIFAIFHDVAAA